MEMALVYVVMYLLSEVQNRTPEFEKERTGGVLRKIKDSVDPSS